MLNLFSLDGRIGRLSFAFWSLVLLASQRVAIAAAVRSGGQWPPLDWAFALAPHRLLGNPPRPAAAVVLLVLAFVLLSTWALVALAFRRARDGDVSEWVAAFAIAPILQVAVILFLFFSPTKATADRSSSDNPDPRRIAWSKAVQGIFAGVVATVAAVAVGALVFGAYGYGIFIVAPFVTGVASTYFANRRADFGARGTRWLVLASTLLGAIALVGVALEGVVCIILAAPIGGGLALLGGVLGRKIALNSNRPPQQALSVAFLLPLVFALEVLFPARVSFETLQSVVIDAPADAVWRAILVMQTIDEAPALPFRLGMAYPLRGEVIGEGVGAERRGEFSTGVAIERVTEWIPKSKLAFVVVEDVPAMRELSPYENVHSPHVHGYFRTLLTSFELHALSNSRTEVIERTSHELRLDPSPYWLPMARLVVDENNARVLRHLRRQAEADYRSRI